MAQPQMQLPPQLMKYQQEIEADSVEIRKIEAEYQKVLQSKRSLTEKKSENEMVMQELNIVEPDQENVTVFKLIGPVLAKQEFGEAKTNVKTRLDFMQREIDRMDALEKEFLGKVEDKKQNIMRLQKQFQAEAQKMAAAMQQAQQQQAAAQ